MYYVPKAGTVFVHLEDMVNLRDHIYRNRVFMYLGGKGLVYQYSDEDRNCHYPLTHEEFRSIQ